MSDRELSNKLSSGEITQIKIGGTASTDIVPTTGEVDAKVALYAKLDGSTPITKSLYEEQVTAPTYAESNMYYKDGVINIQGAYDDVTLQIGQEMHFPVVNNSGADIPNGTVVRQAGVVGGEIQVVPALADTFANARILGVATHDIADTENGIVTTFGTVSDIDTSALAVGGPIYLSSTVAGGVTATPPDIATQVGGIVVSDAVSGVMRVSLVNNVSLPSTLGFLQGFTLGNDSYDLTATPQALIDFNSEGNLVTTVDKLTGKITPIEDGSYRANFSATIDFASVASTRTVIFAIYNVTTATVIFAYKSNIPRDATVDSFSFNYPFSGVIAGHEYQIIMSSDPDMTITFEDMSFDMESIHIR